MSGQSSPGGETKRRKRIDAALASVLFASVGAAFIIGLTAIMIYQGYRDQFVRAEARAAGDAHIVAVHTQWVVEASLQALERIRDTLQREQSWAAPDSFGDISHQLEGLPDYVRISVFGPRGNLRLSNAEDATRLNVADETFFTELEQGVGFVISPMVLGEGPETTGFVIGRRLEDAGTFMGVATITISNAMLSDVWRSLELEAGSTVSLVRDDGWIVARYPPPQEVISLADYELFTEHLPEAEIGTYAAAASPVDGEARMVGYRQLETLPLVALAAISTDKLVERYIRNAAIAIGLIMPGLIGMLAALVWLLRILKRDRNTRERLAQALEHNQILFREIHHRVKNNLQAVSALVALQPVAREVKQEMSQRIAAMVAVHEHIYRTDQFDSAEASAYLEKLLADIAAGFDTTAEIETDMEPVQVHRDHLMPLGLIVNELVCNAMKYAFADGNAGTISVALQRIDSKTAQLRIADNGAGFDHTTPSEGMGRRLVAGLTQQMNAQLQYGDPEQGSLVVLTFPTEPEKDASPT